MRSVHAMLDRGGNATAGHRQLCGLDRPGPRLEWTLRVCAA